MSKTWSPLQTAIFNLIEDPNGGNAYQADLQVIGPDSRKYMGFDVIPVDKKNHLRVGTGEPIGGTK